MEYLIKYSAYYNGDNGYYVEDYEEIRQDLDSVCESVAYLEDQYKDDDRFCYEIFELYKCDSKLVTENPLYSKVKIKLEQERVIDNLKTQIGSKRSEISNHEYTKNKYGKWDKYDEQILSMEKDLKILQEHEIKIKTLNKTNQNY